MVPHPLQVFGYLASFALGWFGHRFWQRYFVVKTVRK